MSGIPSGVASFRLWRMTANEDPKSGRPSRWRQQKLLAPPDKQGKSVDLWPVALFNLAGICGAHGAGRYRVEWLDAKGVKLGQETFEIQAAAPRGEPAAASASTPGPGTIAGPNGQPLDAWGFMAMLDQREQAALARAREESERAGQRDRDFMATVLGARPASGAVVAGGAGLDAREIDLIKREMALNMREEVAKVRAELLAEQDDGDDRDPAYKPPKSVGEAASRVGIKLIQELEDQAPELLEAAIPAIIAKLQRAGFKPSAELQREAREARRGAMNGKPATKKDEASDVTDADFEEAADSVEH